MAHALNEQPLPATPVRPGRDPPACSHVPLYNRKRTPMLKYSLLKKKKWKILFCATLILPSCISYGQPPTYGLAIKNVKIFDGKTKKVQENKTILINSDEIAAIVSASRKVNAAKTIEGNNRLVVAGFIDTHTHLKNVYGTLEDVEKSGMALDRKKLSDTYLRYGTTTLVDMGQPEKWMDASLGWQKNPSPDYPNLYISGGAVASEEEGRKTYMNHVAVKSPEAARFKVREYAGKGVKHLKIYWKLKEPEMEAAISEGQKLNMTISAHLDNNVTSMWRAVDLGVKNFEHMLSLPPAVLTLDDHWGVMKQKYGFGSVNNNDKFLAQIIFFFDYIKENPAWDAKLKALFVKMAKNDATLSTAIHIMGAVAGKTYFFTSLSNADTLDLPDYDAARKERLGKAFGTMMGYLKAAHDKGVKIRIGTDCRNGGKAFLSELLLLHEANFTTEDILQIATLNGAQAMDLDDQYGTIEKGKKADLVLFDRNPFDDYKNFLSEKTVIKGGKVFED
jgi:imidazolonepropionase-like amidohydrolase